MSTISQAPLASEDLAEKIISGVNNQYTQIKDLHQKNHISYSTLDFFDYIPFISNASGVIRAAFGALEVLFGIPAFPVQLIGRVIYRPTEKGHSSFFINKGIANIVRGNIAQVPLAGNLALYVYDYSPNLKNDFQKAFGINN